MFNFNPSTQDQVPQIQLQGAQNLGAGIQTAGTDIGAAIDQYAKYHQLQQQAQGTVGAAHSLGMISDKDLSDFQSLPASGQMGFASNIAPLLEAQGNMYYKQLIAQSRMMNANTNANKPSATMATWQ